MIQDPMTTIRSLKGPGLSVLVVLLMHKGSALKAEDLRRWTGYANQAVTDALSVLRSLGLVVHGPRGFSLVDQFDLWFFQNHENHDSLGENHDFHDRDNLLLLLNPSEDRSLLINNNNNKQQNHDFHDRDNLNHDNHDSRAKKGRACGKPVDNLARTVDNFLSEVLESYGIVEPKRGQLAALEGLTVKIVHELVRALRTQTGERYTTGLLVHALEAGSWRVAAQVADAVRAKYTGGEFGAFVEH